MRKFESDFIFQDIAFQKTERKNLSRFLYAGFSFTVLLSFLWIGIGINIGNYLMAIASLIILFAMICMYKLLKENRLNLAAHLFLISTFIWISFLAIVLQGNLKVHPISVHHWLLVYVVLMQFILINEKKRIIFIYFLFTLLFFIIFEFRIFVFTPIIVDHKAEFISYLVTPITILLALITMNFVFVNRLINAEDYYLKTNIHMDSLLKNLLPEKIAKKIIKDGKTFAEAFSECSVLFVKVIGFEKLYDSNDSQEVVKKLAKIFSIFDDETEHFKVERIKTIGDFYMVASGVPEIREDHGIEISQFALALKKEMNNHPNLDIRIGINSGPVVAGLIGKTGLIYDLWGDTVNVASRMESTGVIGEIQITGDTKDVLGGRFKTEDRGKIEVKGKGYLKSFLLKEYKSISKKTI